MYSTILMVALSTVGFHKCHGCHNDCAAVTCGCSAAVDCGCYSACGCAKVKKHKCGLFKRIFHKCNKCACSCASGCSYDACSGCSAPACSCAAPAPDCCPPAPSCGCASAATNVTMPAVVEAKGFKVERSPIVAVSFEKAEFRDEPVVVFSRR